MKRYIPIILYIWLYLGWFACVWLGKIGEAAYSLFIPCGGWLIFCRIFSLAPLEYIKALILCLTGILADGLASKLGLIHFSVKDTGNFIPLWMISLWLLFIPTIFLLKKPLGERLWLAALLGGIIGPASYKSGEFFGILRLDGFIAVLIYVIFWTLFLPFAITWIKQPCKRCP